jgi:integrase
LQAKISSFNLYKDDFISYSYISKWWKIKESLIKSKLFEMIKWYCDRYNIGKDDFIFHSLSRNPLNSRKDKSISQVNYRRLLKYYWAKAWISKHIKSHTLRATFITLLHTKGLDIQQIKDAVWHNSIATTSLYIKNYNNYKESASDIMEKVLF